MKLRIALIALFAAASLLLLATTFAAGTQSASYALEPIGITPTVEPPTPTPGPPCVLGKKIDDLHVGLPGWTIHAKPCNAAQPVLTTITDGNGNFRFSPLAAGCWTFWEDMQPGWAPVTPWMFNLEVQGGSSCTEVRFEESSIMRYGYLRIRQHSGAGLPERCQWPRPEAHLRAAQRPGLDQL